MAHHESVSPLSTLTRHHRSYLTRRPSPMSETRSPAAAAAPGTLHRMQPSHQPPGATKLTGPGTLMFARALVLLSLAQTVCPATGTFHVPCTFSVAQRAARFHKRCLCKSSWTVKGSWNVAPMLTICCCVRYSSSFFLSLFSSIHPGRQRLLQENRLRL